MAGVRSVHRLQVCGIRTLLPATVLVWLIRHGLSIVERAPIVFLPCIGSVPCPLRKASRAGLRKTRRLPRLSETGVTDCHSAEHSDDRWRHWRRGRGSRPLGAPDVSVRNVRRSDSGASAGFEGPECNLGNRERSKVSRGNKRRRSAERNFGSSPARSALVAWRARPAMMGSRTTNSAVASGGPKRVTDAPFNSRVARQTIERLRMAALPELSVAQPCFQAGTEPARTGDGCETTHRSEAAIRTLS